MADSGLPGVAAVNRSAIASLLATVMLTLLALGLVLADEAAASPVMEPTIWKWPIDTGSTIVRPFEPPTSTWGAGHRGVDLPATASAAIRAIGPGTVAFAGTIAGRGVVVVQHETLRSTYEPVTAAVQQGDAVDAGDLIGLLQSVGSHCSPDLCLHLGIKHDGAYIDPLTLFETPPIRLKPLEGAPTPPVDPSTLSAPATTLSASPWARRSVGGWMQRPRLNTVLMERG